MGKVIRTGRSLIKIGRNAKNELVLSDNSVADHHASIATKGSEFTASTSDPRFQMILDRQWKHPRTAVRGAFIILGRSEIFVFPGEIEDEIIQEHIRARKQSHPTEQPARLDLDDHTMIADLSEAGAIEIVGESSEHTHFINTPVAAASKKSMIMEDKSTSLQAIPSELISSLAQAKANQTQGHQSTPNTIPEPKPEIMPMTQAMILHSKKDQARKRSKNKKNAWGDVEAKATAAISPTAPKKPKTSNAWGDPIKKENENSQNQIHSGAQSSTGHEAETSRPLTRSNSRDIDTHANDLIHLDRLLEQSTDAALEVLKNPDGEYATSIRLLSARLNERIESHGHRVFMICSALPLTGKTTAALNLALVLAEDPQRRVALIEADFRNPRLAEILGLKNKSGLLDVVSHRRSPMDVLHRIEGRNLIIFTSGGRHRSPASLLAAPELKTIFRELASSVDVAIIDAPSILPHADTNLLLPLVDASLMVCLEDFSDGGTLERVLNQIGRDRVVGTLYNKVEAATRKRLDEMRDIRMTVA